MLWFTKWNMKLLSRRSAGLLCILLNTFCCYVLYINITTVVTSNPDQHKSEEDLIGRFNKKKYSMEERLPENAVLYQYSMDITQHNLHTFKAALPPTLPDYRNPCWYEEVPGHIQYAALHNRAKPSVMQAVLNRRCQFTTNKCWRLRCFPYFFLIGATKSGTTDIFKMLKKFHPGIVTSQKEPKFIGHQNPPRKTPDHERTYAEYLDLFDYAAEIIRTENNNLNHTNYHTKVIGDFSPSTYSTCGHWDRWPGNINQSEPRITTAHLIYHIRPETKLLLSIREPVSRAISHFYYGPSAVNRTKEELHECMKGQIHNFTICLTENTLRHCAYQSSYLTKGLYYVFVRDWLNVFDSRQLFVFRFENYITNRIVMINRITRFLGIEPLAVDDVIAASISKAHNVHKSASAADVATIDMLTDFYRPWQLKMDELLKEDSRLWS